jgi:hypothetical protein
MLTAGRDTRPPYGRDGAGIGKTRLLTDLSATMDRSALALSQALTEAIRQPGLG